MTPIEAVEVKIHKTEASMSALKVNPPLRGEDVMLAAALFGGQELADLDRLVSRHTSFSTLLDLVVDAGGSPWYTPSLRWRGGWRVAAAYNRLQEGRKCPRRALV